MTPRKNASKEIAGRIEIRDIENNTVRIKNYRGKYERAAAFQSYRLEIGRLRRPGFYSLVITPNQ